MKNAPSRSVIREEFLREQGIELRFTSEPATMSVSPIPTEGGKAHYVDFATGESWRTSFNPCSWEVRLPVFSSNKSFLCEASFKLYSEGGVP